MRYFLLFSVLLFASQVHAYEIMWDDKDVATRQIGICTSAYLRAAHKLQIGDRPGAAISGLSRAATTLTANMFLNREGESVPGKRMGMMSSAADRLSERLDDPSFLMDVVQSCDKNLPDIAKSFRGKPTLFGKQPFDLQSYMVEKYKSSMGL